MGGGAHGEAPGRVRGQREQGNVGKCLHYGFYGKEQAGLGLTSLDNFSGFWAIGAAASFLVLDPGMIRIEIVAPSVKAQ